VTETGTKANDDKSLPTLVDELRDLVVRYAKQETVEPLKGLGRFVAFGVAGALLLALGFVLLLLGGLRALQEETGSRFTGNWSWAPYLITLVGALVIIVVAVTRISAGRDRKAAKR
jgi:hypothetical protein